MGLPAQGQVNVVVLALGRAGKVLSVQAFQFFRNIFSIYELQDLVQLFNFALGGDSVFSSNSARIPAIGRATKIANPIKTTFIFIVSSHPA